MGFWEEEKRPMTLVDGFESGYGSWRALVGKEIRIRWPDTWEEAFYIGDLIDVVQTEIEDTQFIQINLLTEESVLGLVFQVGKELDVWIMTE